MSKNLIFLGFKLVLLNLIIPTHLAYSQLSPSGYTGAINTPTASVVPLGNLVISATNNNPEQVRRYPGVGSFGSVDLGVGPLPGLEVVGRLSFDGDLYCNQNLPNCLSSTRDLSASAKYQIPINFPFNSKVAIGANDFAGAAKNYTQKYVVISSPVNNSIDVSTGFSKGYLNNSYMKGLFSNFGYQFNNNIKLEIEVDSRELRSGFIYTFPLTDEIEIYTAASYGRGINFEEKKSQISAGINFNLDGKRAKQTNTRVLGDADNNQNPPKFLDTKDHNIYPSSNNVDLQSFANLLASTVQNAGFAQINISHFSKGWLIRAEPIKWRKSQLEALGILLFDINKLDFYPDDQIRIELTYLQNSSFSAVTTAYCLNRFYQGYLTCNGSDSISFRSSNNNLYLPSLVSYVNDQKDLFLKPQFELKPIINYVIGNEFGLYNYSMGANLGWEVPLGKGLMWSGSYVFPLTSTSQYIQGQFENSKLRNEFTSNYISYSNNVTNNTWIEISAGSQNLNGLPKNHYETGSQLEFDTLSDSGRIRLQGVIGNYYSAPLHKKYNPKYLSTRYSLIPGLWSLDLVTGQFYNGDRGYQISSNHWFDNFRIGFYYRNSGNSSVGSNMPKTQFLGFQIILPFGPKSSFEVGDILFRGGDHIPLNLQSTINQSSNNIIGGYGVQSVHQHGLYKDLLDYDRNGLADLQSNVNLINNIKTQ